MSVEEEEGILTLVFIKQLALLWLNEKEGHVPPLKVGT